MLTVGWFARNTFIPTTFSLLSSQIEQNRICSLGFDVICMVKNSYKMHYCYNGEWLNVSKLHKLAVKNFAKGGKITYLIIVSIRESKKNLQYFQLISVFQKKKLYMPTFS